MTDELPVNPDAAQEEVEYLFGQYGVARTDSAKWANTILPKLRATAGFKDHKGGTYTVIPKGYEPEPMEHLVSELADTYLNLCREEAGSDYNDH